MSLSTPGEPLVAAPASAPSLIQRLGDALEAEGVAYCQWKGHAKRERWLSGAGDVDLLVDRAAAPQLAKLLAGLGFKRAVAAPPLQLPGVDSYLGHDPRTPGFVHVHVHYRLVLGAPWTTTYAVPIEQAVLAASTRDFVLRAPAAEHELLLLVLRAAQRCTLRHLVRGRRTSWLREVQRERQRLEGQVQRAAVAAAFARDLPAVRAPLWNRCLAALDPACPAWRRYLVSRALRRQLRPFARRPSLGAVLLALRQRIGRLVGWSLPLPRKRLAAGGMVFALLGGDGAGKTTCARQLEAWLASELAALRVHLGLPPRTLLTMVVGGALKVAAFLQAGLRIRVGRRAGLADHLELLRFVCMARDRHRLYGQAHRFAARGGVVIAERYPTPANFRLAGPSAVQGLGTSADTRLTRALRRIEADYYARMLPPGATIVLRLPPELAVRRKPEEPAEYVRERAQFMWETSWEQVGAHVVDASRPLAEVLGDLKALVWSLV